MLLPWGRSSACGQRRKPDAGAGLSCRTSAEVCGNLGCACARSAYGQCAQPCCDRANAAESLMPVADSVGAACLLAGQSVQRCSRGCGSCPMLRCCLCCGCCCTAEKLLAASHAAGCLRRGGQIDALLRTRTDLQAPTCEWI
jgi:hypothetical protein